MVAIRPLSVDELAELLAFDFDSAGGGIPKFNARWRWEDQEEAVLSTCSSLVAVAVADGSRVVQFSHFSVKEFLMSDRLASSTRDISHYHISLENAHTVLARACLGVLLSDSDDNNGANSVHLAGYAARHWMTHALVENVASRVRDGMEHLFDLDKPYFDAWVQLHNVDHDIFLGDMVNKKHPRAERFYYAALCGFHELVEYLSLKYPEYVNAIGGSYGTALHVASDAGHVHVVRSLLQCGVDVDVRGLWNRTPLQFASDSGCLEVVKLLLDPGHADANSEDEYRWTPLLLATYNGHLDVVRVLLHNGADVNIQDKKGRTPLHVALLRDKPQADKSVRLLLEHGANPNAHDNSHQTPLHLLTPSKLEVARVLMEHGGDVGAEDREGRTPLQASLERGHYEIARLLSEYQSRWAQI